jgi:uncharacterized protein (UPF0332 family)
MKEETGRLLDKASRAIHAATTLLREGDADFAAGRAYYAMFYTAEALLNEKNLRFRKHASVHGAFGKHFASTDELDRKFHRWLLDAFDKRLQGDYGVDGVISADVVAQMIEQAREFLDTAKRYLGAGK